MILAACGQAGGSAADERYYFVSYVDADAYAKDEDVLTRCSGLPGTRSGGSDDSYPPGDSLIFTGSSDEQQRLEDCLKALPNVRVIGPAKKGDPRPPRLVG